MFLILYFFQVALAEVTCGDNETLFKGACVTEMCFEQYLPRIGTVSGGTGTLSIDFKGQVEFVNGADIQVSLTFNDVANDGTMHRDNANSCIYDQLNRYKVGYTMPVADNSEIVSTYDSKTQKRKWTWTIKAQNFKEYLETQYSNDIINYTGYYGIVLSLNGGLTQATYQFTFEMALNKSTKASIKNTEFNSIREDGVALCNPSGTCQKQLETVVNFCITCECTSLIEAKNFNLYLNQQFCVKQEIITEGFKDFILTSQSVYYLGDGMKKKVAPTYYNNTTPGVAYIKLSVEFAYSSPVQILVHSIGKMAGDSAILTQEQKDQQALAAGLTTTETQCVKTSETATSCPTCEEQIKNGGTESESCSASQKATNDTSSEVMIFTAIVISLLF